jgi:hypothetical protein
MPLLFINSLPSDLDILPLSIVKKGRRLKEKRIQKGALKQKQTKYSNCLQLGYNKRHCIKQPIRNRKAKKAHN